MSSLTSSYKEQARRSIQQLLSDAVVAVAPTSLAADCVRVASSGRSAVIEHQGIANAGDFASKCSVGLYRYLCHLARKSSTVSTTSSRPAAPAAPSSVSSRSSSSSSSSSVSSADHENFTAALRIDEKHKGALVVTTRSNILGIKRVTHYLTPSDLARGLIEAIPSEKIAHLLADVRVHDKTGMIIFTTRRHMTVQRKRDMLPCVACGLFYKGERGIRDHMLVKHRRTYEQSKAAAAETRTALVPYWRTGSEVDAQWIQSLEEEALQLSEVSNLIKTRELSRGLHAASVGALKTIRMMVEKEGWNPNDFGDMTTTDRHGSTALMWSCGRGHLDVCQYLVLQCNMNPTTPQQRHRSKRTPLHWAARNGHLEICQWLVEVCGANHDARTADGKLLFVVAAGCCGVSLPVF